MGGKKTTYTAKADKKKGGLGRRNAHNDAANSRMKNDSSLNVSCIEKDPCAVKKESSKALCGEVGVGEKICIRKYASWFNAREEEEGLEYEDYVNGYLEDEMANLTDLGSIYPVTHEKLLSHLEKLKTEM